MRHVEVANIILSQLDGNKFIAMTGAKNFIALNEKDGAVIFHIGKNSSKANRVKITLEWDNTYTMEFIKHTPYKFNARTMKETQEKTEILETVTEVYCDTLQEVFENYTGLYTHL